MKKIQIIKKLGAIAVFGFLCAIAFSRVSGQQNLPFDENSKQVWVQTHSLEYRQMLGLTSPGISGPTQMTETEKLDYMRAHNMGNPPPVHERPVRNTPELVVENPQVYNATNMKVKILRADFEALPQAKRQSVLNDPRFVIIEN
jgi:hypothetical protein